MVGLIDNATRRPVTHRHPKRQGTPTTGARARRGSDVGNDGRARQRGGPHLRLPRGKALFAVDPGICSGGGGRGGGRAEVDQSISPHGKHHRHTCQGLPKRQKRLAPAPLHPRIPMRRIPSRQWCKRGNISKKRLPPPPPPPLVHRTSTSAPPIIVLSYRHNQMAAA